jgi:hypothetical protein
MEMFENKVTPTMIDAALNTARPGLTKSQRLQKRWTHGQTNTAIQFLLRTRDLTTHAGLTKQQQKNAHAHDDTRPRKENPHVYSRTVQLPRSISRPTERHPWRNNRQHPH